MKQDKLDVSSLVNEMIAIAIYGYFDTATVDGRERMKSATRGYTPEEKKEIMDLLFERASIVSAKNHL
jgi:hypothetical protein